MRYLQTQKPMLGAAINWSHPLTKGFLGWWLMNERSGNRLYDLSRNGNVGTFVGDVQWVPGRCGPALNFPGSDDYVNIPWRPEFLFYSGAISAWFKTSTTGQYQMILSHDSDANGRNWQFRVNNTNILHFIPVWGKNVSIDSPGAVTDGKWHHGGVSFYWDGHDYTYIRLFLDGRLVNTMRCYWLEKMLAVNAPLTIGASMEAVIPAAEFVGQIDDVRIYRRSLSDMEFWQLYATPFAMFDQELLWNYYVEAAAGGFSMPLFLNGMFKESIPSIMVNGIWKPASSGKVMVDGNWKNC